MAWVVVLVFLYAMAVFGVVWFFRWLFRLAQKENSYQPNPDR